MKVLTRIVEGENNGLELGWYDALAVSVGLCLRDHDRSLYRSGALPEEVAKVNVAPLEKTCGGWRGTLSIAIIPHTNDKP